MKLLIVESPGKIKKLQAILGSGWTVKASVGHVRELANDGDHSLGFDMGNDRITCRYIPRDDRAKKRIAQLRTVAKQATQVVLATDPDREGETIAWHLKEVLRLRNPQRVSYTEITDAAVRSAIAHPRALDLDLIAAGRCRDCLDKLVGYRGSPLVWALNNGAKSVGRVQSATLHLLCQREREITAFVPQDYWSVFVDYAEGFRAFYLGNTSSQETEPDQSDDAGTPQKTLESSRVSTQAAAEQLIQSARAHAHQVIQVEGKTTAKSPPAPFTTSTLQQAAGSRLRFSPEKTMQVAQKLYEAGLITYMRTDSIALSVEFCQSVREWLQQKDPDNIPTKVARHRSSKTAQEAHEAIRPTDIHRRSAQLKPQLSDDEFKLYVIIWMRTVASQCKPAQLRKTKVISQSGEIKWQARGQVVEFTGYAKYWNNLKQDSVLPALQAHQSLSLKDAGHEQKQTQPPPRYSEPKLVQLMERKGIGRPSTYAPTIKTLKQRDYVQVIKGKLQPTALGLDVDAFLAQALPRLLETEFTAQMESDLDAICEGKQDWQKYLIDWHQGYFEPALDKAQASLPTQASGPRPQRELEKSRTRCPKCNHPLSKVPTKKLKKKYFLKCEQGCESETGKDLVLFWSDRDKQWQQPRPKGEAAESAPAKLSDFACPVCGKPLEEYSYTKNGQAKALLRCSDPNARSQRKHKDVVFFQSRGVWWSKKFGELTEGAKV